MDGPNDNRGIECPRCGCRHCPEEPHQVAQTFAMGPAKSIRRRRRCRECRVLFTTYERTAVSFVDTGIQQPSSVEGSE